MTQLAKGQPEVPKFLSTHPQNQDRQERLQNHMEEVIPHTASIDIKALEKGAEAGCNNMYGQFSRKVKDGMW